LGGFKQVHLVLNGESGSIFLFYIGTINDIVHLAMPCDDHGNFLQQGTKPPPEDAPPDHDWFPFRNRVEFELAEFLFVTNQMPANQTNTLLDLWSAWMVPYGSSAPFLNARELYEKIDASRLGDIKWETFDIKYKGKVPDSNVPSWMTEKFEVWYRNPHEIVRCMLANKDFKYDMDLAPFHEYDKNGDWQYCNVMSGDWAWTQAVSGVTSYII
jgi:hypothetical protein